MSLKEERISDDEDYCSFIDNIKVEPSFDHSSYTQEKRSKSRNRFSRFNERSTAIRGKPLITVFQFN